MSLEEKVRYTSRTAQASYQRCHRLGYTQYHWDGIGLSKKLHGFEIVTGTYVHEAVARLLLGEDLEEICKDLLGRYEEEITQENLYTFGCPFEQASQEQKRLIEGLTRAWALKRLPYFQKEFEVLEVEQDRHVELVEGVEQEFKLDALLKHRMSGLYYVLSNKTTGAWDYRKQNDARTDMQGLSEVWGIEQALGIKVHGVIMEYMLHGKKEIEEYGGEKSLIYWTPLVRGWFNPAQDEAHQYAWRYNWTDETGNHRLTKGYERVCSSEVEGGVKGWIDALDKGEFFPSFMPYQDPLGEQFYSIEYYREEGDVKDWLEQIQWQEKRISEGLREIENARDEQERRRLLNKHFPQFRHSCNYPLKCQAYELCWGTAGLDPFMYGFKYRVPHHEQDKKRVEELLEK